MIVKSNVFTYGEVGERLSGIRESEVYQQSAQKIENLLITEMGNLKIAKAFDKEIRNDMIRTLQLIDTKYNFYIACELDKIRTYKKNIDESIGPLLFEHNLSITGDIRIFKLCDDKLFAIGDNAEVFEFNKETGAIGRSNFLDLFKFPVKDKEVLKLDIYKIYQVQEELRVSLLGTYENPKLKVENNEIFLSETNVKIDRIYKQYKMSISKENLDDPEANLVFGVFRNYQEPEGKKKYLLGNEEIEFTEAETDSIYGGKYFTRINKNGNGELGFGEIIRITEKITTVGIYQDRLLLVHNGKFYFSKKSNYIDFRNDTKADSSFFFKITPINNIYPEIYEVYIGDKIYVATSKGIYVISTNNILVSNSYSVFIASEIPCSIKAKATHRGACELINNTFYYLTDINELRSVEQVPTTQGFESYSSTKVEKYDINSKFFRIGKFKYEDKIFLVATKGYEREDYYKDTIYLYEQLDYKLFRRFSLKIEDPLKFTRVIFLDKNIIFLNEHFGKVARESRKNMSRALLRVNPPYMESSKGHYNNDYSSRVVRVFIKVLNENKEAIKGIKIGGGLVRQISTEDDLFSVFKVETSFPILNGFDIEIVTKENNKIFEILGIDCEIEVVGD